MGDLFLVALWLLGFLARLSEIISGYERPLLFLLRLRTLLCFLQRSIPFFTGVVLGALLRKDSIGDLEVAVG